MQQMYTSTARAVKRLPFGERAVRAVWVRLPLPMKRVVRRTRHRVLMRSPSSMMSRAMTPGVENRLLSDPAVVDRLLETERAKELLSHQPAPAGRNVDWVAQVAVNNPAAVVNALSNLAEHDIHVAAAVDRLVSERPAVLTEEQVIDTFLGFDEFTKRQYWHNPRIRAAFLDYLSQPTKVAQTRFDADAGSASVTVVTHDGGAANESGGAIRLETPIEPPVAADLLLSLDPDQLAELWEIESFRSSFVESLVREGNLFNLRMLLRSDRLADSGSRQALFDALAGAQAFQLSTLR